MGNIEISSGKAIDLMKIGKKISRNSWVTSDGKYLFVKKGCFDFEASDKMAGGDGLNPMLISVFGMHPALFSNLQLKRNIMPCICMAYDRANCILPYTLTQEDILADDWFIKD